MMNNTSPKMAMIGFAAIIAVDDVAPDPMTYLLSSRYVILLV